jgi:hypothetical protein
MWISQQQANDFLAMQKISLVSEPIEFPQFGGAVTVPLLSTDGSEEFLLDVRRNRINVSKGTFQNRVQTTIILARLDVGGAPHRNPDGVEIGCPHLHVYREGYGDKWAIDATPLIGAGADHWQAYQSFITFCNVVQPPNFQPGLFS